MTRNPREQGGRYVRRRETAGRVAVATAGLLVATLSAPAQWFINKDVEQRDPRGATDFDILIQGDISGRIQGGGQSPVTNAFPDPRRTVGGDGLGNTIVRFDSSSGATIPNSPGTRRHFGIHGSGPEPRILQMAWSFPNAPQRVHVAALSFNFNWDPVTGLLAVRAWNDTSDVVVLQRTGFLVTPTPYSLEDLNATTLPPSAFTPVSHPPQVIAPASFFDVFTELTPRDWAVVLNAEMTFFDPVGPTMNDGPAHDWWQVIVPAPGPVLLLALGGLLALRRRRGMPGSSRGPGIRAWPRASVAVAGLVLAAAGIARADQTFVIPLKPGLPANEAPVFRLRYVVGGVNQDVQVKIDTGDQLPQHGGLVINSGAANNVAGRLGLNPMGPGTAPLGVAGAGGAAAARTNVPMPAGGATFPNPPAVPPGQAAQAPPIPGQCSTMALPAGIDALIGSQWLSDFNYARFGDFWVMGRKKANNPAATAQNFATGTAIAAFLSGGPILGPDGRPLGAANQPVRRAMRHSPPGTEAFDGGYEVATVMTNPATGTAATQHFLIKSGLERTLISESLAYQLNLNPAMLPIEIVALQLQSAVPLPTAMLHVDVFGDPSMAFTMPVSILPDSLNPLNFNYLAGDFLGHFFYWEVSTSDDGLSGQFWGWVPAPSSAALLSVGLAALARRRR